MPPAADPSEKSIQNAILVRLSADPDVLIWRQNVGVAEYKNKDGRRHKIRYGVPGMADIGAICCGMSVQIEVKSMAGKLSYKQKKWRDAVVTAGGMYSVVRSVEDALNVIKEARWRAELNTQTMPKT